MDAPVSTKNDVLRRLRASSVGIRKTGVRRLGLFGSFVHDAAAATSDVDFLVEFEPERKSYDNFWALSELLEDALQRPVDLLTTESLSPHLGPRILAEVEYVALGE